MPLLDSLLNVGNFLEYMPADFDYTGASMFLQGTSAFGNVTRRLESTNDDAFWPTSGVNDTYTPSANVMNGHKLTNAKFSLTAAYLQQVLTLPIVFLGLGFVSCIFTNLGLCFRCCCKCCKCLPKEKGDTPEERVHAVQTQKKGWYILFGTLALFVIIADFLCYYGYNFIDDGVNKFFDAMTLLYNICNNIKTYADTMAITDVGIMNAASSTAVGDGGANPGCCAYTESQSFKDKMKAQFLAIYPSASSVTWHAAGTSQCLTSATDPDSSCTGWGDVGSSNSNLYTYWQTAAAPCPTVVKTLIDAVPLFASATSAISTSVGPMATIINSFTNMGKQYLMDLRRLAIFVIFAIALVEVIMLVAGAACQSRKFMKFAIFCGMLFYLIIILLCCPFMIFTSLFADLCTAPAKNLARQVTGSTRSLLVYYATCKGKDTIRENVLKAQGSLTVIATQVEKMGQFFCPLDTSIPQYKGAIEDVKVQIGNIATQVSCPTLRNVLRTFLEQSLCGGIYSGIYSIWISQLITSFFLLMLLITSTVLYQYFGTTAKVISGYDVEGQQQDGASVTYAMQYPDGEEGQPGFNQWQDKASDGGVEMAPVHTMTDKDQDGYDQDTQFKELKPHAHEDN